MNRHNSQTSDFLPIPLESFHQDSFENNVKYQSTYSATTHNSNQNHETQNLTQSLPFESNGKCQSKRISLINLGLLFLVTAFSAAVGYVVPTFALQHQSLYISRAVLGLIGGGIGLSCTFVLHEIVQPHFEAAVWRVLLDSATHSGTDLSHHRPVPLSILDSWIESIDLVGGFHLLLHGTRKKPMSISFTSLLCLLFFIFTLLFSSGIGFLYARTVNLETYFFEQNSSYSSIQVLGTLKPDEPSQSLGVAFNSFGPAELPPAALQAHDPLYNQTIYFPEVFRSIVEVGGYGYGSNEDIKPDSTSSHNLGSLKSEVLTSTRSDLYWARLGERVACQAVDYSLFETNFAIDNDWNAYFFIPKVIYQVLFSRLGLENRYQAFSWRGFEPPENVSNFDNSLKPFPITGMDTESIAVSASNLSSFPSDLWTKFATQSQTSSFEGKQSTIILDIFCARPDFDFKGNWESTWNASGYSFDAAVCVSSIDPFIFRTTNTSSSYRTTGILSQGLDSSDSPEEALKLPLDVLTMQDSTSTAEFFTETRGRANNGFTIHFFSILGDVREWAGLRALRQLSSSFGNDSYQTGDQAYFDMSKLEEMIGKLDASYSLPYFVGTQTVEALEFKYKEEAKATVSSWAFPTLIGVIFVLGLVGCFSHPTLPNNLPHRPTTLAAFYPILRRYHDQDYEAGDDLVPAVADLTSPRQS